MNTIELKAERIRLSTVKSPQQVQEEQQLQATQAMKSYFSSDTHAINEGVDNDEERSEEQGQDSKQVNEWKNPQVRGRHKPTRKSNTQEEDG
jgi:hypothetical protein